MSAVRPTFTMMINPALFEFFYEDKFFPIKPENGLLYDVVQAFISSSLNKTNYSRLAPRTRRFMTVYLVSGVY